MVRACALAAVLIVLLGVGWGLGELITSAVPGVDADAVGDLAAHRDALLTAAAHAFSWAGSGYMIAALALISCALLYRRGETRSAVALALSTLGGTLIANLDKLLVGRPRPPVHHLESVSSSSFPSGHATQSAAFLLALLFVLLAGRPPRSLAIAAAATVGALLAGIALSRVYLGVHYPSDVATGLILGGTWGLLATAIIRGRTRPRRTARRFA